MLTLILPPIIIVLSLFGLFWVLHRKRAAAERIMRSGSQLPVSAPDRLAYLRRLQRFFDRAKDLVLKSPSVLRKYFWRGRDTDAGEGVGNDTQDTARTDSLSTPQRGKIPLPAAAFSHTERKRSRYSRKSVSIGGSERNMSRRPMVSDRVAHPEPREGNEKKNHYEEILIERIAMNPRDIEAYERLGDYYMEQKEYIDAKECYKQVLRLSPVNRKAKVRMRRLEKILSNDA